MLLCIAAFHNTASCYRTSTLSLRLTSFPSCQSPTVPASLRLGNGVASCGTPVSPCSPKPIHSSDRILDRHRSLLGSPTSCSSPSRKWVGTDGKLTPDLNSKRERGFQISAVSVWCRYAVRGDRGHAVAWRDTPMRRCVTSRWCEWVRRRRKTREGKVPRRKCVETFHDIAIRRDASTSAGECHDAAGRYHDIE